MKKIFIYQRDGESPKLYTSIKALWLCHSAEMGIGLVTLNKASIKNKGEGVFYCKQEPFYFVVRREFAKTTEEARQSIK